MIDYYRVLSLEQDASAVEIRRRFLQLVRQQHPDRFRGDRKVRAEVEFQSITQAFNVLIDPERRRLYDQQLTPRENGNLPAQPIRVAHQCLQRGIKAYRQRDFLQAAESFDRATREAPDNALAWHHLARACSHNPRWLARATKAIVKACELEPMNAGYHKLAGCLFVRAGMPVRATRYFRSALRWGGEDPEVEEALRRLSKERG